MIAAYKGWRGKGGERTNVLAAAALKYPSAGVGEREHQQ
jgi:hypothetical protein